MIGEGDALTVFDLIEKCKNVKLMSNKIDLMTKCNNLRVVMNKKSKKNLIFNGSIKSKT